METAKNVLKEHITGLKEAAQLAKPPHQPFTLAIGSSITARVLQSFSAELSGDFTFEIIAGVLCLYTLMRDANDF